MKKLSDAQKVKLLCTTMGRVANNLEKASARIKRALGK